MDRFLFEAGNKKSRLRQAIEIQFAQAAPPVIYYGTEAGLSQGRRIGGDFGDLEARRVMPWAKPDHALLKLYRRLITDWKLRTHGVPPAIGMSCPLVSKRLCFGPA